MSAIRDTLIQLHDSNGSLTPQQVVDAARNEQSPLHSCFEWDDSRAGSAYRLWQARQLIKTVTFPARDTQEPTPVFFHAKVEGEPAYVTRQILIVAPDVLDTAVSEARTRLQAALDGLQQLESIARDRASAPERKRYRKASKHVETATALIA